MTKQSLDPDLVAFVEALARYVARKDHESLKASQPLIPEQKATTTTPASHTGDLMFMQDIRNHYGHSGRPASRSFIYEAEARGDIPPSAKLGHQRVWSRKAVLAMDAARFDAVEKK